MKYFLICIVSCFTSLSYSQFNQSAQHQMQPNSMVKQNATPLEVPPHNGIVKPIGKFYIEAVSDWMAMGNNVTFYLLKSNGNPVLNSKATCSVRTTCKEVKETLTTQPLRDDAFTTRVNPADPCLVEITFIYKKKEYKTLYQTEGNK